MVWGPQWRWRRWYHFFCTHRFHHGVFLSQWNRFFSFYLFGSYHVFVTTTDSSMMDFKADHPPTSNDESMSDLIEYSSPSSASQNNSTSTQIRSSSNPKTDSNTIVSATRPKTESPVHSIKRWPNQHSVNLAFLARWNRIPSNRQGQIWGPIVPNRSLQQDAGGCITSSHFVTKPVDVLDIARPRLKLSGMPTTLGAESLQHPTGLRVAIILLISRGSGGIFLSSTPKPLAVLHLTVFQMNRSVCPAKKTIVPSDLSLLPLLEPRWTDYTIWQPYRSSNLILLISKKINLLLSQN